MQPKVLQKFQWLKKTKYIFPDEFSFVHASIFEQVLLRLFDSFQVKILSNLTLNLLFEMQKDKLE